MARTKRWSYSTGERGRNKVRAFEHQSGVLMLEFSDRGKRTRISLGHKDRTRAKQQADDAAAKLGREEDLKPKEITLGALFDSYGSEVTPTKSERGQRYDGVTTKMFSRYFGAEQPPLNLSIRDWNRFIGDRRAGRIGPGFGPWQPVSDRTVERDLRLLLAVFNWATIAGDGRGGVLLERNPFKGYPVPKEKNPRRVVLADEEYDALILVSMEIDWRFHVALVLAHETGHRIGAIRKLLWSDIDFDAGTIRWRAEHEKNGYEHVTPMTGETRRAAQRARSEKPGVGETPLLPAPGNDAVPVSRYLVKDWWRRAEALAGLERVPGRGWHSLRRKFASDLMNEPLKTLCQLGGWKSPQTVLMCYQHADERELRRALDARRNRSAGG